MASNIPFDINVRSYNNDKPLCVVTICQSPSDHFKLDTVDDSDIASDDSLSQISDESDFNKAEQKKVGDRCLNKHQWSLIDLKQLVH